VVVTKACNFYDRLGRCTIADRSLGCCSSLDGDCVHLERETLRPHSLPLYRSLLSGDDTPGACSRFQADLCQHLHVGRTCPADTYWRLGNSVDHRTEKGALLKRLVSAAGPL